eukprot:contig_34525_g8301
MPSTTRASTKAARAAGLAQAVRLASSRTCTRRAALAIVNVGRAANTRVSCGSLARALTQSTARKPPGRRTKLTAAHEMLIVDAIKEFQRSGFNITKEHLIEAVADAVKDLPAEEQEKWKDGRPSEHWVRLFCRRHGMRLKKESLLESVRARAMTKANLATHFSTMAYLIQEHNITPDRMSNWDETGFSFGKLTTASKKVIMDPAVGQSVTHGVDVGGYAEHITLAASITADGRALAPLVVLPGVEAKYRTLVDGVNQTPADFLPQGALVCYRSPAGVNSGIMEVWAKSYLEQTKELRATGKTMVIFDGYSSHLSVSVLLLLKDNNVVVYALPSYTSHVTQPLDVAVFGPMKAHARQRLSVFSNSPANAGAKLNVYVACEIMTQAYVLSMTPANVKAGFSRTGIHPLSPHVFTDASFELSQRYETDTIPNEAWVDVASRFFKDGGSLTSSVKVLKNRTVDTGAGCHVTTDSVIAVLEKRAAEKTAEEARKEQAAKDRAADKDERAAARKEKAAGIAARAATRTAVAEAAEERNL